VNKKRKAQDPMDSLLNSTRLLKEKPTVFLKLLHKVERKGLPTYSMKPALV
jgi:hypothetical protein